MIENTNIFDIVPDVSWLGIDEDYYRQIERRNKEKMIEKITRYSQIFDLKGGTSTIPNWRLKQLLLIAGFGAFAPKDGKLYFLLGHLGDTPTPDYIPSKFIFANAYIPWSGELRLKDQCVLAKNDTGFSGILPILKRHTHLQTHVELSFFITTVMSRLTAFGVAGRDQEAEAIDRVLEDIEKGKIRALTDQNILNQIHTQPYAGDARFITSLIEMMQYSKAAEASDLGLQANWNAKRETLTSAETLLNTDVIHPFVDNMWDCWQEWIAEVNEKYGEYLDNGEYTLDWASSWKQNDMQEETQERKDEAEAEMAEAQAESAEQYAENPEAAAEIPQGDNNEEGDKDGETD